MNMATDTLFNQPDFPSPFRFDETVAKVFDDMIDRSVPFYSAIQAIQADLACQFAQPQTNVYDLGCSTGNFVHAFMAQAPDEVGIIGCDGSPAMLEKCRKAQANWSRQKNIHWQECDLHHPIALDKASVVVLCLILQFIKPDHRPALLAQIYRQLLPNGAILLFEKIKSADPKLEAYFTGQHEAYKKKMGYSQLEIARKRQALENVLIPFTFQQNIDLLRNAGFSQIDSYFRWNNFCGLIALKSPAAESS